MPLRRAVRPNFRRNQGFGEALGVLTKAQHVLDDRHKKSRCLFPLGVGQHCGERAIDGHTVQEALLSRISTKGHVWTFLRDIANVTQRLIAHDSEESKTMYDLRRWSPKPLGIGKASVYHFCCWFHDRMLFRPIEHSDNDDRNHPIDEMPLTSEQRVLLTYRIAMLETELLSRTKLLMEMMPRRHRRNSMAKLQTRKIGTILAELKSAMDSCEHGYLRGEYDDVVDTPIDSKVTLPIGLAVVDTYAYRNDPRNGQLFLSVLPLGPAQRRDRHAFEHRVIASRMTGNEAVTQPSINQLKRMTGKPDQVENGRYELMSDLLVYCRNAFFSYGYEELPENIRAAIEESVYEVTTRDFPQPFQSFL